MMRLYTRNKAVTMLSATLTRWIMHDNHTFTRLPTDNEAAHKLAMECFDHDSGWIDIFGTWSDESTNRQRERPQALHGHGPETREEFSSSALQWLQANPSETS